MTRPILTAVITDKRGMVLSVGKNSYSKTHTFQAKHAAKVGLEKKIYIHAEIDSILHCRDLSKAHKISVFRYGANGRPLNAKPCPICMSAIEEAGIKHIEYTTGD